MRPDLEVADVFHRHGADYRRDHAGHLGRVERRVMAAVEACRPRPWAVTPNTAPTAASCGKPIIPAATATALNAKA